MNSDDPTLAKRTAQAGQQLFDALCAALATERGVHLETAVTAAGYLAGSALLAGAGVDVSQLAPGEYVIIEKVNETGPMVLDALAAMVRDGGANVSDAAAASAVSPDHQPMRQFDDLMRLAAPLMKKIVESNQIPLEMTPFVAARTAAQLILAGRQQLDPSIGLSLAADAMVRASKTVPPAMG